MRKVFSRGNINAPIMIIGECPGKDEEGHSINAKDKYNNTRKFNIPIPFIGAAGRELQLMLSWIGLEDQDWIMSNIYKDIVLTAEGRASTASESQLLPEKDNITKEIVKINPRLIMTLGKGPLWLLKFSDKISLTDMRISGYVGKVHHITLGDAKISEFLEIKCTESKTYNILPLFHPSAILRSFHRDKQTYADTCSHLSANKEIIEEAVGRVLLY